MSSENTCATIAEPTSAPSTTASASGSAIRPRAANEASSMVVAVELCRMPVMPTPAKNAPMRVRAYVRNRLAQRRAERARHAGAHHAHAPEQERDAAEEGGEQFGAGHLWRKTSIARESAHGSHDRFATIDRSCGIPRDIARIGLGGHAVLPARSVLTLPFAGRVDASEVSVGVGVGVSVCQDCCAPTCDPHP